MRPVGSTTSDASSDDSYSHDFEEYSENEDSSSSSLCHAKQEDGSEGEDGCSSSLLNPPPAPVLSGSSSSPSCHFNQAPWKAISYDQDVEVFERIGGGGMALVFRGRYKGNDVALKTIFDPSVTSELRQTFLDELLVMSRMDHSNIVKFIGASMAPPNLFFAMELCKCSLYDALYHQTELTFSTADSTIVSEFA